MNFRKLIGQERPAAYVCRSSRFDAPVTSAQGLSRASFFHMLTRRIPTQKWRAMPRDSIPYFGKRQVAVGASGLTDLSHQNCLAGVQPGGQ